MNKIKIKITQQLLNDFDMSKYENIFLKDYDHDPGNEYPFWDMDRYHKYYKLLAYLSTFYNNEILVDIGTRRGHSAASLAYNENNTIYTYNDRKDETPENAVFEKITNIKPFILSDYPEETGFLGNILGVEEHKDILLKSSLIFMDVDPHDGGKESALFNFLLENNYKGLTVWDDTASQLNNWFEEKKSMIINETHISSCHLNDYSWTEGTGVICFGEQEIILE